MSALTVSTYPGSTDPGSTHRADLRTSGDAADAGWAARRPGPVRLLAPPIREPYPAERVESLRSAARRERRSAAQGTLTLDVAPSTADPSTAVVVPVDVSGGGRVPTPVAVPGVNPAATRRRSRSAGAPPSGPAATAADPVGTAPPEALQWAGQFIQAALEVAAGLRPPTQLIRWSTEDVHATLARRFTLGKRFGQPEAPSRPMARNRTVLRSVRGYSPDRGVVEACAVVTDHDRVRAVALRMERLEGRWRATALEFV